MTRPSAEILARAKKIASDNSILDGWAQGILAAECEFLQAEVSRKDKKIERMLEALKRIKDEAYGIKQWSKVVDLAAQALEETQEAVKDEGEEMSDYFYRQEMPGIFVVRGPGLEPEGIAFDQEWGAKYGLQLAQRLGSQLSAADRLLAAAKEYTTEREYQNVEACRKDQDWREQLLLNAISDYEKARGK